MCGSEVRSRQSVDCSAFDNRSEPSTPYQTKYGHHKARNLALIHLDGKDHYLAKSGTLKSWEKDYRPLAERASSSVKPASSNHPGEPIVGEHDHIRRAVRFTQNVYGLTLAEEFGSQALKMVCQAMIDVGLAQMTSNQCYGKFVRMFRWATENETLTSAIFQAHEAIGVSRQQLRDTQINQMTPSEHAHKPKADTEREPGEIDKVRAVHKSLPVARRRAFPHPTLAEVPTDLGDRSRCRLNRI